MKFVFVSFYTNIYKWVIFRNIMGIFADKYRSRGSGSIIGLTTVAAILLKVGSCGLLNSYEYSSGSRAGVVNKVSKKGLIWKTYEGQMALEGVVSSGGSVGANVWDFSIDNQARHGENVSELAEKLNDALDSGKKVKIKYTQVIGGWPWRGSTGHYVQSIEPFAKFEEQ